MSMARLARRLCAYCGTAEEGLGHLQQVGPALCHAHDDVRQRCPLRYPREAPAQAIILLPQSHALMEAPGHCLKCNSSVSRLSTF